MSVCIVETLVAYQAWCSEHKSVGPIRETEAAAREDVEHHLECEIGEEDVDQGTV